jgi:hypothetical protein
MKDYTNQCHRSGAPCSGEYAFVVQREADDRGCSIVNALCFACYDKAQLAGEPTNWDPAGAHFV